MGKHELFAGLEAQHWDDLLSITGWEHVPADLDVVRQGQDGTKLYVLAAGTAHVFTRDASGRELPQYLLREGENDFFRHACTAVARPLCGYGPLDSVDLFRTEPVSTAQTG